MIALVQRVSEASVTIDQEITARIGPGLLVFLGVGRDDDERDGDWLAGKVTRLRVFEDDQGRMNRSVLQTGGSVLVVSQFTLYGDTRRGNRPSFINAADPEPANALYESFCDRLRGEGLPVATGTFAADMQVSLINDGPVTLWLTSPPHQEG